MIGYLQTETRVLSRRQGAISAAAGSDSNASDSQNAVTSNDTEPGEPTPAVNLTVSNSEEKPAKRLCNYRRTTSSNVVDFEGLMTKYLSAVNSPNCEDSICTSSEFADLRPLFCKIFSVPASSAPVERIFSQSGLIMRPHRAKMSDALLEALVFLKCNN